MGSNTIRTARPDHLKEAVSSPEFCNVPADWTTLRFFLINLWPCCIWAHVLHSPSGAQGQWDVGCLVANWFSLLKTNYKGTAMESWRKGKKRVNVNEAGSILTLQNRMGYKYRPQTPHTQITGCFLLELLRADVKDLQWPWIEARDSYQLKISWYALSIVLDHKLYIYNILMTNNRWFGKWDICILILCMTF